jgi:hypothetical protein
MDKEHDLSCISPGRLASIWVDAVAGNFPAAYSDSVLSFEFSHVWPHLPLLFPFVFPLLFMPLPLQLLCAPHQNSTAVLKVMKVTLRLSVSRLFLFIFKLSTINSVPFTRFALMSVRLSPNAKS